MYTFKEFVSRVLDEVRLNNLKPKNFLLINVYECWQLGDNPRQTVRLLK